MSVPVVAGRWSLAVVTAAALLVGIAGGEAHAATYYVRTDGGSAAQCNGLTDAPYSGTGSSQACAWNHPFQALPPGGPPRIAGGDSLVIAAGSYMMGVGAPGADSCSADASWDCYMPPVPSGASASQPTRILGAGAASGCSSAPQLWGTERAEFVVNLTDSSNVEIACLDITDHSGCIEFHSGGLACSRDAAPFGPWAVRGIYAEDSSNVTLRDLNVHGLAATGIQAGRLTNWTVERVTLRGNGSVGWDGDLTSGTGDDGNNGTLRFKQWTVEWNGCGETYPDNGQPTGCWGQFAGGYGDGVGTGETAGHWIIEDSIFRYNTSDGLDLLYVRRAGSQIEIRRTLAVGNAGNQLKTTGPTTIENVIVIGNCGFFDGKSFSYVYTPPTGAAGPAVDNCRATGNALSMDLNTGETGTVTNSTITSEGDCVVLAACAVEGGRCGAATLRMRNNIFVGQTDFLQPFESTCLGYAEGFSRDPFDIDYSISTGTKSSCPVGPHDMCTSPGIQNATLASFDAHLTATSPAINAGTTTGAPADDFDRNLRSGVPDIGAYEYGSQPPLYTGTPGRPGATVSGNHVTVSWAAPASGAPPTGYLVVAGTSPGSSNLGTFNVGLATSISGVLGNGRYFVRVFAISSLGQSAASEESSFWVGPVPLPPGQTGTPVVTVVGSRVTVSWAAPATGGIPTSYVIVAGTSSGAANVGLFNVGAATGVAANVGNGPYFIRIAAVNAFGYSLSAEVSFRVGP